MIILEKFDKFIGKSKKIYFLVEEGFHDGELLMTYSILSNNGWECLITSTKEGQFKAYNSDIRVNVDLIIDDIDLGDVLALIIPGGESPRVLKGRSSVKKFIKGVNMRNRPICAICHGPEILISSGLTNGVKMTSHSEIKDQLVDSGALYQNKSVIVDGNIITSRLPKDIHQFTKSIIDYLNWEDTSWTRGTKKVSVKELEPYLSNQVLIDVQDIQHLSVHKTKRDKETLDRIEDVNLEFPIMVLRKKGEWVRILDGNHRVEKAKRMDKKTIKSRVIDYEDLPSRIKSILN
jgi:protease I